VRYHVFDLVFRRLLAQLFHDRQQLRACDPSVFVFVEQVESFSHVYTRDTSACSARYNTRRDVIIADGPARRAASRPSLDAECNERRTSDGRRSTVDDTCHVSCARCCQQYTDDDRRLFIALSGGVYVLWRSFSSVQREVPLFEKSNFLMTQCREASVLKTRWIRSAVLTQHGVRNTGVR